MTKIEDLIRQLEQASNFKDNLELLQKLGDVLAENEQNKEKQIVNYLIDLIVSDEVKQADFTGITARAEEVERLGEDANGYKEDEGIVADQYQQFYNVKLERFDDGKHKFYLVNKPADFAQVDENIKPNEWLTIDFMFTEFTFNSKRAEFFEFDIFRHRRKARNWQYLQENIQDHLNKADIVPMDLRGMTRKMIARVLYYILSLDEDLQKKIIIIK